MSSWKSNLKRKYDEHRHCAVCGISVPPDKEFCSLECKDKYSGYEKKKNRTNYITMALMIGMVVVMTVILPLFQGG